jgi:hypothetical protein
MCVAIKAHLLTYFLTENIYSWGIKYLVRVRERERKRPFSSLHNFSLTQTRNPNCQTPVKKEEAGRQEESMVQEGKG